YLRVYGTAELVRREGQFGQAPYIRITPTVSWSFNLAGQAFSPGDVQVQRTVHTSA
ncbi:MAG: PPOX class F420-dependent oxidoreductase, partial [Nocardia sp.]|nr:PPOX class F420-dependent oxidoreductase [Nocardia sp.]